jgi:hypothetical protein
VQTLKHFTVRLFSWLTLEGCDLIDTVEKFDLRRIVANGFNVEAIDSF